ncbi:MAG: flavodoxin family protein [Methanomassiliicoccales archaeon]|nr:flavodoxin family protein [Methanomassiliicoccales archaeon]
MTTLVLGLNGSPRREGNSEFLLREALRGAASKGASIVQVDLAFMDVSPCRACDACFSDGRCSLRDDMDQLYGLMEKADAIIIASPIYFSGMSSHTKTVVDRCQALWARRNVLKEARAPGDGAIILVAAQPNAKFDNALSELRAFLIGIGVRPTEKMTLGGLDRKGMVADMPASLERAFDIGRSLVPDINASP